MSQSSSNANADRIAQSCRLIEQSVEVLPLSRLAALASLTPSRFHRLFRAQTGLTPRQYAAVCRERRLRSELARAPGVLHAAVGAGYSSTGRLSEASGGALGMTPSLYRSGAPGVAIRFALGETSLGHLLVAESDRGVCAISLGDDPAELLRELQDRFPHARMAGDDPLFQQRVSQLAGLVERPDLGVDLPLDIRGTAFQRRVWEALRAIPPGSTISYSLLAQRLGEPRAARAIARACASNTLALAIPCHRVVRQDGQLSGYRWGIERKRELLKREAAASHGSAPLDADYLS